VMGSGPESRAANRSLCFEVGHEFNSLCEIPVT
jgi:hypothetical protein